MHTLFCFDLQNCYMFWASLAHSQGVKLYKTIPRPKQEHRINFLDQAI
jgi:hypothetical protein